MGDENSIANETFTHAVSVFESAWTWCVKNDARFDNEIIHDLVGRIVAAHNREAKGVSDGTHSDMPITTELRELIAKIDVCESTNVSWLVEDSLNAIDSVHENLEIEYSELVEQVEEHDGSKEIAKLESELKTQRNNFEQATSAREHWKKLYEASQDECKRLAESVKQLESERDEEHDKVNWLHAELKGLEERSIELPKDADDEPVYLGDELEVGNGKREKVKFMTLCTGGGWLINEQGWLPIYSHHVKSDTWERIIEDAVNVHGNGFNPCWTDERDALVARCKALVGDAS